MGVAWKDLERSVAKHFGTTRRTRGDNFGRSDVEVKASLKEWLNLPYEDVGLVVECKYRKDHDIIKIFEKKDPKINTFIGVMDEYVVCWLDQFEEVFRFLALENGLCFYDGLKVVKAFSIVHVTKKVPAYIVQYLEQSREYTDTNKSGVYLPIACLAKARSHRKLVAVSTKDIAKFKIEWHKKEYPSLPQTSEKLG